MKKERSMRLEQFLLEIDKHKITEAEMKLAYYLKEHFNEIVFLNIIDISQGANVSKATIGRFLNKLGFTGYADFKLSVRIGLRDQCLKAPITAHSQYGRHLESTYPSIISNFTSNITFLIEEYLHTTDYTQLEILISLLINSNRLFVIGPSSSLAMAVHFSTLIKYMRGNVFLLNLDTSDLPKQLFDINKDDCLVIFSYYRFNNVVVDVAKWFNKNKAKNVLISNSFSHPYGNYIDLQFILPSDANVIFQSRIIGFFFIELLLYLYHEKNSSHGNFERIEELFKLFRTFSSL